jgi:uncharacterized protein YhbP (UPF0306 family)
MSLTKHLDTNTDERVLLEQYVSAGKLMQFATQDDSGPWLCNVWYRASFSPDRVYFISRVSSHHAEHLRNLSLVAGSIVHEDLEQLGQKVRGVTFRGHATEMPTTGIDDIVLAFLDRWPNAAHLIGVETLASGETTMRMYEIIVHKWILIDEVNFPASSRRVITGIQS